MSDIDNEFILKIFDEIEDKDEVINEELAASLQKEFGQIVEESIFDIHDFVGEKIIATGEIVYELDEFDFLNHYPYYCPICHRLINVRFPFCKEDANILGLLNDNMKYKKRAEWPNWVKQLVQWQDNAEYASRKRINNELRWNDEELEKFGFKKYLENLRNSR